MFPHELGVSAYPYWINEIYGGVFWLRDAVTRFSSVRCLWMRRAWSASISFLSPYNLVRSCSLRCCDDSKVGHLSLVPSLSLVITLFYKGGCMPPLDSFCLHSHKESVFPSVDHVAGTAVGVKPSIESQRDRYRALGLFPSQLRIKWHMLKFIILKQN
jgi:hypothetical protein